MKCPLSGEQNPETKQIKYLTGKILVKVLVKVLVGSFIFSPESMICSIQPVNLTHFTVPTAIVRDFLEKLPRLKPMFQNRMQIIETTSKIKQII